MEIRRETSKGGATYRLINDMPPYLLNEPVGNFSIEEQVNIQGVIVWRKISPVYRYIGDAEAQFQHIVSGTPLPEKTFYY